MEVPRREAAVVTQPAAYVLGDTAKPKLTRLAFDGKVFIFDGID